MYRLLNIMIEEDAENDDIQMQNHIMDCVIALVDIQRNRGRCSEFKDRLQNSKWVIFWKYLSEISLDVSAVVGDKRNKSLNVSVDILSSCKDTEFSELRHLLLASSCSVTSAKDIQLILSHNLPKATKTYSKDTGLITPFHLAAKVPNPNIDVIRQLSKYFIRMGRFKDKDGWLPIHYACRCSSSVEMVQELLQEYPEGLMIKTDSGHTPLHLVCHNASPEANRILRVLLAVGPQAATLTGPFNRLPLHEVIGSDKLQPRTRLDMVAHLLAAHPLAAASPDLKGFTPTHYVCMSESLLPPEMLILLLRACPKAAAVPDSDGLPPLHLVRDVVKAKLLVGVYPTALSMSVPGFGTALHEAAGRPNVELVQYLYSCRPESLSVTDRGWTPLGCASIYSKSLAVVKAVYDLDPLSDNINISFGTRALSTMCSTMCFDEGSDEISILRFLIHKFPKAVSIESNGDTPYSIAVRKNAPPVVRRLLLRAAPELDPEEHRRMNYAERRMGLFLFFIAVNDTGERTLFNRLQKASVNNNLTRRVFEFL